MASAPPSIARRIPRPLWGPLVVLLTGLGVLGSTAVPARAAEVGPVGTGSGMTRIGLAPRVPSGATAAGALAPTSPVHVTIALTPRDPQGLADYAQAVSTPGSGVYHHYLTVPAFAARFGATPAQVAAVQDVLRAEGLAPSAPSSNGLSLSVSAPAGVAANAFDVTLERYRLADGHEAIATTSAPAVPNPVAGLVQGVIGLDGFALPSPSGVLRRRPSHPGLTGRRARAISAAAPQATTAPGAGAACPDAVGSGAYTAGQIASAYGFSSLYAAGDGGAGRTIALFELEPFSASDVQAYQNCYGTHTGVSTLTVDGGAGSGSGSGEAALDIEDVVGLAPKASVLVYEGPNTGQGDYDTYAAIIKDDRAQVISTSWGACEQPSYGGYLQAESTLFQEAAAQGQTVLAAAGDSGADDCGNSSAAGVDDPASQPYVTGVGGTTMDLGSGGAPHETVWNSTWGSASGAGGGGVSGYWPTPSYQTGTAISQSQTTCGGTRTACREVPDVTADADVNTGYAILYSGYWYSFGGTSAAAPTWAALAVLADAWPGCSAPVGFLNPGLYAAGRTAYSSDFNDITSGDNTFDGITGFSARAGYDMASGLGSPRGAALVGSLCGAAVPPTGSGSATTGQPGSSTGATTTGSTGTGTTGTGGATTGSTGTGAPVPASPPSASPAPAPVVTVSVPGAVRGAVGRPLRIAPGAADSAGLALTWRATGLPSGVSIDPASGAISGVPAQAARVTVTVTATDTAGGAGQATITLTIAGAPRVTSSLTFPRRGRVELSLTAAAGAFTTGIRRLVLVQRHPLVRLGHSAAGLARLVLVRGAGGRRLAAVVSRRGNALVVLLRRPATGFRLRLLAPAAGGSHGKLALASSVTRPVLAFSVSVS